MYFFALDLAPLDHSASSTAAFLEFSTAAFWAAASAFWELWVSILGLRKGCRLKLPLRFQQPFWCSRLLLF